MVAKYKRFVGGGIGEQTASGFDRLCRITIKRDCPFGVGEHENVVVCGVPNRQHMLIARR